MGSEKEDVMATVKSCLLTFKNGTNLAELNKDYKLLEGRNIPFRPLGFQTLESFIQSVPGIRTTRRGMDLWVETLPTKETEHISRMIAEQNQSKSRRRRRRTSDLRQASRGSHGMLRSKVRPVSSAYRASSRTHNTGSCNTGSRSNNAPQMNAPRPLMQQLCDRPQSLPGMSSGNHRFLSSAGTQFGSPTKRLLGIRVQLNHDLDYAKNHRTVTIAPSSLPISKPPTLATTSTPASTPTRSQISDTTNIPSFNDYAKSTVSRSVENRPSRPVVQSSIMENQQIIRPLVLEPLSAPPSAIPWQPPPSRLRPSDRLTISPTSNTLNSTGTNGNSSGQVTTVPNLQNQNGGVSPQTAIPILHDPREELKKISRELNKPDPTYKIIPVQGKSGSMVYGRVQIGSLKFSSYPEEAKTEMEAERLAALEALIELRKEHSSTFRLRQTMDKDAIKTRLLWIVDQHNGVFIHKVPAYYQEKYNENLPDDWTKYILQWTELTFDKGVHNSMILHRADPSTADQAPAVLPGTEKELLNHICLIEPGPLELPEDNFWVAYVELVVSSVEIWVRLIDDNYSAKLEAMAAEMDRHYSSMQSISAELVKVGGYYVKKENNTWHRVRVIECDSAKNEAEVFFIDIGDVDIVNTSELLPLDRKFSSLSAQAMKVSLAGLEDFANCESIVTQIEEYLLGRVFYVEVLSRDVDDDGPTANVIFCDTSGPVDVEVNSLITTKILQAFTPKLEGKGKAVAVYISHVETNGDVYVQVENEGMKILTKILNKITHTVLSDDELKRCTPKGFDRSTIYFVRCMESGDWYRAKIVDAAADSTNGSRLLKMFLIDFGRTILVNLGNVIQLEILYELLAKYPAQAIKVRLETIDPKMFNDKMIQKIKELAPPSQLLRLKIVKPSTSGSPPVVELFKRIQPDNGLLSINNTIDLEPELTSVDGDGNNNVTRQPRRRIERTNSKPKVELEETARALPAPKIANIGDYFDVHVTMAAHPRNFTVQPFETKEELRSMMMKLQDACTNLKKPHPTLESIGEGCIYAAKHSDGDWYRGCVLNVINEHQVSIYFVDYGDVAVISIDKLQPLAKQFLELPYQALKARLVGIKPRNVDWSTEDSMRLQDLIVGKDLVSIVAEVYPDQHLPLGTVLGLTLIDVSTNDDVYIGEVLVREGRAIHTDEDQKKNDQFVGVR